MRVALVIPAWNEAASIGAVLAEVPAGVVDEVFVVVGGPDDPTRAAAERRGATVIAQTRRGYGAACWEGTRAAVAHGADVVAFLDGDYADPPAALPAVLAPLLTGQADVALGCRVMASRRTALPLHAQLGNRVVLALLRRLLGRQIADLPSFKAIRTDCLARLDPQERTYGWTVELVVKSVRAGLRVAEVPVAYRPRLGGRSKVSGTVRGTLGAGWQLCVCAVAYARWQPVDQTATGVHQKR